MDSNNNQEKKKTWRSWLIKKLLTSETNKEDVLQILGQTVEDANETKNQNFEDIDDKVIENIKF